jgi:hypothetical protein
MNSFEHAREVVQAAWPDYDIAPYGYEGDLDWFVLLLPMTAGGRVAAVSKFSGAIRWINENAPEYNQDLRVGDWTQAED